MRNSLINGILITFLFLFSGVNLIAQNILYNSDFEEYSGLPPEIAPGGNGLAELAIGWDNFVANADYLYDEGFNFDQYGLASIGITTYGNEEGHSEAIGQDISNNPLLSGLEYLFQIEAFSGNHCAGIELVGFPNVLPDTEYASIHPLDLPNAVSLYITAPMQAGWNSYSCTFIAPEEIRYVVIAKEKTDCYEYVTFDNVFLGSPEVYDLFGEDQTICEGDTLTLDASSPNASYLWQDNSNEASFSVTESGVYSVEIIQPGCILTDTISVEVSPRPVYDLGEENIYECAEATVILDAQVNGATYTWQDGSNNSDYLVSDSGEYSVAVDLAGCIVEDTIQVYFLENIVLDLGGDRTICLGDSLTLQASELELPFLWSTGEITSSIQINEAGTYGISVGDDNCFINDEMQLSLSEQLEVFIEDSLYLCPASEILLDATRNNASYMWQDESTEQTYTVSEEGIYRVEVSVGDCVTEDSVLVLPQRYDCFDCKYFVPNAFSPDFNGVNDVFKMFTNCQFSTYEMKIFDRWGVLIFQSSDPNESWEGTFRGKNAQQGIYTVFIDFQFYTERQSELFKGEVLLLR